MPPLPEHLFEQALALAASAYGRTYSRDERERARLVCAQLMELIVAFTPQERTALVRLVTDLSLLLSTLLDQATAPTPTED